ncbi:ABC transporter permease [Pelistega europaea]|uniref:ABC transporter permease subunit n=1 Tax=Pelistega europaea TaxID=106147 RepID=A0A7Y4LA72_9BURK|nr:ABC transporter permease subunit [Pelistega europaea]NOL48626.1 ABC transporter permease subunit [Pelistega europaea]
MKGKGIALLVCIPFVVFYLLFQVAPLIWVVINGFQLEDGGWGLENFEEILSSKFYLQSIQFSLEISVWSSLLGLVIAFLGSYSLSALRPSKLGDFILSFNSMTSNFSGIPLAFAFIILLGVNGAVNIFLRQNGFDIIDIYGKEGVIIIYTYFQIPLAVLLLYPAFEVLQKEWQEAAELLGASVLTYWRKVAIPVLMPALFGTLVILFANAIGAYSTVYALSSGNFNIVPIRIGSLISGDLFLNPYMASALAFMLVILMLLVTLVHRVVLSRYNYQGK